MIFGKSGQTMRRCPNSLRASKKWNEAGEKERGPTMAATQISISVNLVALTAQLQFAVQGVMSLVAVGLHAGKSVAEYPLTLPDTRFFHQFATNHQWTPQHTAEEWRRWILVNGFRDVSEMMTNFLGGVQRILAQWSLPSRCYLPRTASKPRPCRQSPSRPGLRWVLAAAPAARNSQLVS